MDQNQQEPPQTAAPELSVCSRRPRNPRNPQRGTLSEGEGGFLWKVVFGWDSFGKWFLGANREGGDKSQPGVGVDPEGIFCSDFGALCQGWNVSSENGKREQ